MITKIKANRPKPFCMMNCSSQQQLCRHNKSVWWSKGDCLIIFPFEMDIKVGWPKDIIKRKRVSETYIIDKALIKIASKFVWLWVAIEPKNKEILTLSISKEINIFTAERFVAGLVKVYGKHPVLTNDGGTWYSQTCSLKWNIIFILHLKRTLSRG